MEKAKDIAADILFSCYLAAFVVLLLILGPFRRPILWAYCKVNGHEFEEGQTYGVCKTCHKWIEQ